MGTYTYAEHLDLFGGPPEPGDYIPDLDGLRDMAKAGELTCVARSHGLDTIVGYVVRRTFFDAAVANVDVHHFDGAASYSAAVAAAQAIRLDPDHAGWAVVDSVYGCGCRGQG